MLPTGNSQIDAESAFRRASRARRRAALLGTLRRSPAPPLDVLDERDRRRSILHAQGIREIPLDAITATLEPTRAPQFDRHFRPARAARRRWEQVWLAEQRGELLPPISVVRFGDRYAVRDGHHRVSVARARGATTIDAVEG